MNFLRTLKHFVLLKCEEILIPVIMIFGFYWLFYLIGSFIPIHLCSIKYINNPIVSILTVVALLMFVGIVFGINELLKYAKENKYIIVMFLSSLITGYSLFKILNIDLSYKYIIQVFIVGIILNSILYYILMFLIKNWKKAMFRTKLENVGIKPYKQYKISDNGNYWYISMGSKLKHIPNHFHEL